MNYRECTMCVVFFFSSGPRRRESDGGKYAPSSTMHTLSEPPQNSGCELFGKGARSKQRTDTVVVVVPGMAWQPVRTKLTPITPAILYTPHRQNIYFGRMRSVSNFIYSCLCNMNRAGGQQTSGYSPKKGGKLGNAPK